MELDEFLRALLRRWWILVVVLALGVLGAWGYLKLRNLTTAEASVAVLETALTKPMSGGMQAQVSYSTVIESRTLAQRVIDRLGLPMTAKQLQGRLAVKMSPSLIPTLGSPLYLVRAKDRSGDRAIEMANTAVEEAATLFADLNAVGSKDIESVFQKELATSRQAVTDARNKLIDFQRQNNIYDLPLQLQTEAGMVYQIKQSKLLQPSPEAAKASARITVTGADTDSGPTVEQLDQSLASETKEMERLSALDPELGRWAFDVQLAQNMVTQVETRLSDMKLVKPQTAETEAMMKALESQLAQSQERLTQARKSLQEFQSANKVSTGQLQQQTSMVYQIKQQLLNAQLARAADAALTQARGRSIDEMGKALQQQSDDVNVAIQREAAELERLSGLNVKYQDLLFDMQSAEARVKQEQEQVVGLVASLLVPPSAQVRTVDTAATMSSLRWSIAVYAIAALLGLFLGITVIYVMGYFDRTPHTADEAGKLLDAPVLTSVPKSS